MRFIVTKRRDNDEACRAPQLVPQLPVPGWLEAETAASYSALARRGLRRRDRAQEVNANPLRHRFKIETEGPFADGNEFIKVARHEGLLFREAQ